MQMSLVQEVASLFWDIGQGAGWVSPGIQRGIREADARAGSPRFSLAQRAAYGEIGRFARTLGWLQIFQIVSGDRPATPRV